MRLSGKKVLVTGADGFIGSHLTEELIKIGAKVRVLVQYNSQKSIGNLEYLDKKLRAEIEIMYGDIQDPDLMKKLIEGCEVVFHLAALIAIPYSYLAPEAYVHTNILGTLHVLQACRINGVRMMVHTSTSETYGTALYTPIDERHPLQAQSPYAATKIGADKIVESFYKSFNFPVATIRPFNTFGPRQSDRAIIPTIISQIAAGKDQITLGSLAPVRDFLYVKDTANGYIKIAESENTIGEVINVGTGRGINIGDLATLIMELMRKKVVLNSNDERVRPGKSEVMQLLCNYKKAQRLANWEPQFTLEQGLKETIQFVQANCDKFKPDKYNI
jgi:NAD dependent epimerase/dehydratase